ncbi:hypothetical protein STAN_6164 [Streptomyces sp. CBMAI 2042]|nr:hypothetical protein STAN_6164 [Streptomyces sp. CBMAI 2042]
MLTKRTAHPDELRIRVLELRVEVENRVDRYREFLPELRALVNDHPLHEWFHGQLLSALHRSGRRREALHAYQENGITALSVADVDGVKIAGILIDAGTVNSPTLMEVGQAGSGARHTADPTCPTTRPTRRPG